MPPAHHGWPTSPQRDGPLSGVRVLDLSRILAGPYATMHLADLGADVIKVESPDRGDETRHWGPPFADDGTASYFLAVNHNKRSLTLNLDRPRAREIARDLATCADVVIDNFLPGRMARFGLDRESLLKVNSAVITCTISGFGSGNAYTDRPGFDFLVQAMGGLMSVTGQPETGPTRVGVAVSDLMCGVFAGQGILAALLERTRTGVGRHVEVSLLDTQISMLINIASGYLVSGVNPGPYGNSHPSIAPYELLQTSDGPLAFAVGTDRQFGRLAEAVGVPELARDPRFATNGMRVRNRVDLVRELESRLSAHDRSHWLAALTAVDVPVAPLNSIKDALSDDVVKSRMLVDFDGVTSVRSPIRLDGGALDVYANAPSLGQDTDAVLTRLGIGIADIDMLRADGTI